MRSFLVGKMGWSTINAMPNVSGGYGLFDKKIVIAAGGYSSDSLAEDMDMIIRMVGYCCEFKRKYRIVQIPANCCWTEVPNTLITLSRQRIRWGRGLIQTFMRHRHFLFNHKYKQLGLITLPYVFIFELIAPVIEFIGLFLFIYQAFTGVVNWRSALIIFLGIYTFCVILAMVVIFYDYMLGGTFRKARSYIWIVVAAFLEPFIFHPFVTFFSVRGYINYLINTRATWGEITRRGYSNSKKKNTKIEEDSGESSGVGGTMS